jgi:drug/metabolite transporter (DMT)-like permease
MLSRALPQSDYHRGVICILIATFLFSLMMALSKALTTRYAVGEVAFFRYATALLPLLPFILKQGGFKKVFATKHFVGHFWRAVVGTGCLIMYFYAAQHLPLAEATALSYTNPIFITLFSMVILKERIHGDLWMAVLAGFAGVLLIAKPEGFSISAGAISGVAGAACQALATIGIHKLSKKDGAFSTLVWFSFLSVALSAPIAALSWKTPEAADWLPLIICGLSGFGGQIFITLAYRLASPPAIGHFNYVSILWAGAIGYFMWHHVPGLQAWMGAAVVVASGYYIFHRERVLRKQQTIQP